MKKILNLEINFTLNLQQGSEQSYPEHNQEQEQNITNQIQIL